MGEGWFFIHQVSFPFKKPSIMDNGNVILKLKSELRATKQTQSLTLEEKPTASWEKRKCWKKDVSSYIRQSITYCIFAHRA